MKPRISVLTLGVADLERSLAFYRDGLGLPTDGIVGREFEHGAVAFFDLAGGLKLAIWAQDDIAHDTGLAKGGSNPTAFTTSHNVRTREEVDQLFEQARRAGAGMVSRRRTRSTAAMRPISAIPTVTSGSLCSTRPTFRTTDVLPAAAPPTRPQFARLFPSAEMARQILIQIGRGRVTKIWPLALLASFPASAEAEPVTLRSPDGRIAVEIATDRGGTPTYSVRFRDRVLIVPSALGLSFERYQTLSSGMAMQAGAPRSGEDRYRLIGKASEVRDPYRELTVAFAEPEGQRRRFDVIVRAYDDGIAIRYRIPAQPSLRPLRLAGEVTQFRPAADYACHGLNLGRVDTSHEGEFDPVRISQIRPMHLFDLPLVCAAGEDGTMIAFAEADRADYAGLYLSGMADGRIGLEARLAPRPDDPAIAVRADPGGEGVRTPWRVIMIGDGPGDLIESTLITSLNPPAEGDFSWVRPGKYAWDWWNGPTLAGVPQAGMNDATIRGFIDFAAENGLQYMLVDDGWYLNSGGGATVLPGADPLRVIPGLDLPGLIRHAETRGVGLWLWVHWRLIDADMDRILGEYARWGIRGVKVDFMDRSDQDITAFYHRLMRTAARHRLMVNLHGAYPPTGLIRTWPNYLTQEGVLGAEYNKWTQRITARHNVTLPFTRMLLGPMDYTPGGFRNATPETFEPRNLAPMVMTTRGQALAMYVVYDSPFQGVSDSPDAYRGQPGMDFIRLVPAAWDETRFISGRIGEHIAVARRSGRDWYVGAMTNEEGRELPIPLAFLGPGRFEATIWRDGGRPDAVESERRSVTAADRIALRLAPSGGGVLRIAPAN